jgi:hypothetical protein
VVAVSAKREAPLALVVLVLVALAPITQQRQGMAPRVLVLEGEVEHILSTAVMVLVESSTSVVESLVLL